MTFDEKSAINLAAELEGYTSVPVDIDTFIDDPYYLGSIYGKGVYPYWREKLREIYPNPLYSPYIEVCISGAIGIGKSTISIIGVLYDLYRVTLLKNPHKKYKLIPTTPIVITFITATLGLGRSVLMNQVFDAIGASPYFSKIATGSGESMFPHNVGLTSGSRASHSLGKAVIGAVIDEANFQEAVGNQAIENYNAIRIRMESRFMTAGGEVPCRLWLASSRNESSSFLESHIEASRNDPKVAIYEPAIWDIQSYKNIYSGSKFKVFTGSDVEGPKIITNESELAHYSTQSIIDVPIEYKKSFEDDLIRSLKDLAGVASRSSTSLIHNPLLIDQVTRIDNGMTTDEITLSLNGNDQLIDYLKPGTLLNGNYFIHVDAALSGDRLGFAMSAVTKNIRVSDVDPIDGIEKSRISPQTITPIAFGVKAQPNSQIPLWKIRKFIVDLRARGVVIKQVSYDGFQSADSLQLLAKLGFNSKYVSVDRTKDAYLRLASGLGDDTVILPRSRLLKIELTNLQNFPKKIDHPDHMIVDGVKVNGSKDVADAVTASSYEAVLASSSLTTSSIIDAATRESLLPNLRTIRSRQSYITNKIFGMNRR